MRIRGILALVFLHMVALPHGAGAAGVRVTDPRYKLTTLVKDSLFAGANGATIGGDGALYIVHTATGTTTRIDLRTMKPSTFVPASAGTFITDDITTDGKGTFIIRAAYRDNQEEHSCSLEPMLLLSSTAKVMW